jgi:hypothetical protein
LYTIDEVRRLVTETLIPAVSQRHREIAALIASIFKTPKKKFSDKENVDAV